MDNLQLAKGMDRIKLLSRGLKSSKSTKSIKFTREILLNSCLPFLDGLVRGTESNIQTAVYRKRTHTRHYLHNKSYHLL